MTKKRDKKKQIEKKKELQKKHEANKAYKELHGKRVGEKANKRGLGETRQMKFNPHKSRLNKVVVSGQGV